VEFEDDDGGARVTLERRYCIKVSIDLRHSAAGRKGLEGP